MAIDIKAIERMAAMRTQAAINASSNTDEQALAVKSLYPDWAVLPEGHSLAAGARVNYGGTLYKVLQGHGKQDGWTPADSPSLFAKMLIPDKDVVPEWEQPDSANPYAKGDRVTHGGKTWESLADGNVWEPGATGAESLWKEV